MGRSFDVSIQFLYLNWLGEIFVCSIDVNSRSQWPRSLRRWSAAAHLLRLWVRIPPGGAWIFVCCECCVLSGRGLCDGLITHPEESYRLWCVVVCDLETSWMRRPWPTGGGAYAPNKCKMDVKKITIIMILFTYGYFVPFLVLIHLLAFIFLLFFFLMF